GPPIWYSGLKPPLAPPAPRKFARVCVERPNRGLGRLLVGLPKLGWLKMLKNSARKRRPARSVTRNIRCTPISACVALNPRSTLRPKLPCCPEGAAAKAALFKILPPGYPLPNSSSGAPVTFGRYLRRVPAAMVGGPATVTGGDDLAKTNASTDHPSETARTSVLDLTEGKS